MPLTITAHSYGPDAEQALLEAIERAKSAGGQHDPLAPLTIVSPSALAGYHLRRMLGRRDGGIVNVQVKPLQALLELIGAAPLANAERCPLPDALRAETIRDVAEQGHSPFGDIPIDGPLLTNLLQRFQEFDLADRAQLDALKEAGDLAPWLVGLYDAYRERTARYYTVRDLAESAAAALPQLPVVLRDIGAVIVYLPGDLPPPQQRFVQALGEVADVHVLLGLTGDAETVDEAALASWNAEPPDAAAVPEVPTAQQIVQSPDAEEEVRDAVRAIAAGLLADPPTPLHRTAILYRQPEPYLRICAEQLDAAGIVWNGEQTQTLRQSRAGRTLDGLLGLLSADAGGSITWATDVAPWLAAAPIRDAHGQLAPIARWNQLARRANLQRGPDDWLPRLTQYRAQTQDDIARLERQGSDESKPGRLPWVKAELAQIEELTTFVQQLVDFAEETPDSAKWSDWAGCLRDQLARLLGDRNAFVAHTKGEDDVEAARWDDVQGLLNQLGGLDELGEPASAARFVSAARRELERTRGHQGRFGDGVYVGTLRSAAALSWDVVYIVGCAERTLPQTRSEDPLLPDAVRAQAGLQGADEHLRKERRDYLAAMHAGAARVLSYPRADTRAQSARLPGRWLLESATARNGGNRIYASRIDEAPGEVIRPTPSFEHAVVNAAMPADSQEYDLRDIRNSPKPREHVLTAIWPPLARSFEQHEQRKSREFTRWDGRLDDGAADALNRPHSAGALQDWAACPYRYFLGRVLRVEEQDELRDELQISALDKGSLVHDILEHFFKDAQRQPAPTERWPRAERERLQAIAEEELDRAHAQGLTGRALLWRRDRERILDDLNTLLDRDDAHRAQHGVSQADAELVFGELPDSQAEMIALPLADGGTLPVRGMVDRIDRSPDGDLIVIDYKTGQERPKAGDMAEDPIVRGQYLQLPIYAEAVRQVYGLEPGRSIDSAYWFITERGAFKYNAVVWNAETRERFTSALNLIVDGVRGGHFPANPGKETNRARGEHCKICSFDQICSVDRRSHWDRIKGDEALSDYTALAEPEDDDDDDIEAGEE